MRRTVIAGGLVAALLLALGILSQTATAQTTVVEQQAFEVTTFGSGFASIPAHGTDQDYRAAQCGGTLPNGGPVIPAQVLAHVQLSDTHLRILNPIGNPLINARVTVTCTFTRIVR
jgi:hypothetical protein